MALEERMAKLEGITEEVRSRLVSVENRLESGLTEMRQGVGRLSQEIGELKERVAKLEGITEEVRTRLGGLESRVDTGFAEMRSNFKWLIGIMITMWVTIILTILLKGP